ACLRRTARKLGHAVSEPLVEKTEALGKKRGHVECLSFPSPVTLFSLEPNQVFWEKLNLGLLKMQGGAITPMVPWSFESTPTDCRNELRVPTLFEVKTTSYEFRPALDKPVQSHDTAGKDLVLFLPVEAEEQRVKDYMFKHCSESGLEASHALVFPSLEAVDVQMQIAILGTSFCMAQLRSSKKMRQTEELQEMEKKIADLSQELDFLQTRRDLLVEEVGEPTETESNLGA
ncbi:unnamed protein product, partial [Durusdinium trenchii]